MGNKTNPVAFRMGVYQPWRASWFARGQYGVQVLEDLTVRQYLEATLEDAEVARVQIDKAGESVKIIIHTSSPGRVIGKRGEAIDTIRRELSQRLKGKVIDVAVAEVKSPELDATLVAKNIAQQLVKRGSFKRAMKRAALSSIRAGAKGIKICCAGRLGGAEIARTEWTRMGSVPLHTLRSDIDYGTALAKTTYGIIGVKVWICRGEIHGGTV